MLSPKEKKDKVVRSTDIDALGCRLSANSKGYFDPPDPFIDLLVQSYKKYLRFTSGFSNLSAGRVTRTSFSESKLPIINNGTYLRTRLVDLIIEKFIQKFKDVQIVSLGGGSDTRAFRLLEKYPAKLRYIEIDFEDSCRIKKLSIVNDSNLRRITNCALPKLDPTSKEEFQSINSNYDSERYCLLGIDLRQLPHAGSPEAELLYSILDKLKPTLILSECVLCYLSEEENAAVVQFWVETFKESTTYLSFLMYEPMSLNDSFGETMATNLATRGINLMTFQKFPTLASKVSFLVEECGLKRAFATDIATVGGYDETHQQDEWIDTLDRNRIRQLELIDEVEEIVLLFKHYCICFGEYSQSTSLSLAEDISQYQWVCSKSL